MGRARGLFRTVARIAILGSFFVAMLAWTGQAQAAWTSPPSQLNATGLGSEHPAVTAAVDDEGDAAYAWTDGGEHEPADIYFNQIPARGMPNPGTAEVVTGEGELLDIAMSADGDGLLVWIDDSGDVKGSSFTAGGAPSAPFTVAHRDGWEAYGVPPQVAIAPDGDAYVVMKLGAVPGPPYASVSGVYIPAGGSPGGLTDLSLAGAELDQPTIDVDGLGAFHTAWTEEVGSDFSTKGKIISATGTPGSNIDISTSPVDDQVSPEIAANQSGESIVAFVQPSGSKVVRIDETGTPGPTQSVVSIPMTDPPGVTVPPSVGLADDGSATVASLVDGVGVYASDVPPGGVPAVPELITTPGVAAGGAQASVDAEGNAFVTINGPSEAGGPFQQLVAHKPAGGDWGALTSLSPDPAANAADLEVPTFDLDVSRSGHATVAWDNLGDAYSGASASRFAAEAEVTPAALGFGSLDIGQSTSRQLTLENSGGPPLAVTSFNVTGAAAADYSVDGSACLVGSLDHGQSCTIDVGFTPSAIGARPAELNVVSDSAPQVAPIGLNGEGVTPPSCPKGQIGTPPNCVTPTCPKGQIGTPPNCVTPTCPKGQVGTPPNCVTPTCPKGQVGTPPNCVTPPSPQARVKISKVKPKHSKVKRGKSRKLTVRVRNSGDATARGAKVCARLGKSARNKIRAGKCRKLGQIAAGSSKTAKIRITVKRGKKAKGKAKFKIRLSSRNAGGASARAVIEVKRRHRHRNSVTFELSAFLR